MQNEAQFYSSPSLGKKSLTISEKTKGLSLVDTSFVPRDSLRPALWILTMSPSSAGHGGNRDTKYSFFDQILRAVFAGDRGKKCLFLLEPACSAPQLSPFH